MRIIFQLVFFYSVLIKKIYWLSPSDYIMMIIILPHVLIVEFSGT